MALEACQEIEQDQSKSYWQKIKKLSRYKKTCTIENINKDGTELYTDKDKADTFAEHFQEAFKFSTNPNFDVNNQNVVNNWYFNYFNNPTDNTYEVIIETEFKETLMHMKNTAPGKDNIKSNTLKNLSPETHAFILEQLNTCLKNNIIPNTWKHGILIPIPKSGLDNTRIQKNLALN